MTQTNIASEAKRQVSLRLPESLFEDLNRYGEIHGLTSITEIVTELLQIALASTCQATAPAPDAPAIQLDQGGQMAAILASLNEVKDAISGIQRSRGEEHEELVARFDVVSTAQVFAAYEAASAVEFCVRFLSQMNGKELSLPDLQKTFARLGKQRALKWLVENGAIESATASDASAG